MKWRNYLIILGFTISLPFQLIAQTNSARNSLSLSIGPSFPFGDFSKTDPGNNLSGNARTGETIKISFDRKLTENFGLEAMIYGQSNGLKIDAFEKQLTQSTFFPDQRTYSNWAVKKNHWMTGSLLAGFTFEYPLDAAQIIVITTKGLAGIAFTGAPDLKAESKSENAYATYTGKYGSATTPAILLGTGIKYYLNKRFSIVIEGDYYKTSGMSFKDGTEIIIATDGGLLVPGLFSFENSVNPPVMFGQTGTRKQTIKSLNINAGFAFSW